MLVKKQYKKKVYWQKQYFKGQLDWYKTKKFCSLYSREKNNIFLAKIVEYNIFLATSFATSIFVF